MSDPVAPEKGAEYLSSWVGDDVKVDLGNIAPEEMGFVIERVFPQKAGLAGVQGTFREHEIGEAGPEEFIEEFFGGGRYAIRARRKGQYIKGVRHVTIAGDPLPLKDSRMKIAELRGIDYEDEEEEDERGPAPWGVPGGGWPPAAAPHASPYGVPARAPVPPPGHPAWTDPNFNPYMKNVKSDDPNQVAGAIQAMGAVLAAVKPERDEPATDPTHLIATVMTATNNQIAPTMNLLMEELKEARKSANQPAPQEKVQLEMMKNMNTMQMETMKQMFSMQTQMMADQAKAQAEIMSKGMGLFAKIATEVRNDDSGSLLDKLPGYLEQLSAPFRGPGGAPGMPGMPGMPPPAAAPGAPPPAMPAAAPAGAVEAPAAEPEMDEVAKIAQHQATQLVQVLKFLVKAQPDQEVAWEQYMTPGIANQQGAVRKKIDELAPTAGPDEFAQILLEAGVPQEEIIEVGTLAASVKGGMEWLGEFWQLAPWVPDDEEEIEEGDLPFTKPGPDGKTEAPEAPSDS